MIIKKLEVDGFRCLMNFSLIFEPDITIIVGENDAGKSSLIDCLKVVTQNKQVEIDDFNHNSNAMKISVEIDNYTFVRRYSHADKVVTSEQMVAKPTLQYLNTIKTSLEAEEVDLSNQETIDYIKRIAKEFGLVVRANSVIANLKASILEKIAEAGDGGEIAITGASFPDFNNILLDGRQFENVSGFFKEVFLKEKQANIWHERVSENQTIEEFVKEKIENYSNEITEKIAEKGILAKMQVFLKNLTEVRIDPVYHSRDLNIDAKVKFMENGQETNIDKKGDGTKRRLSMALLEFKKEESLLSHDESTIYLLDEPDTHLHVKAQLDLLQTVESFANNGDQVILTTHSPFIINSVAPKKIRLLQNIANLSSVRYLKSEVDCSNKILRSIGVENTYLFFSRHLVIVEGETEENFIPAYFLSKFDKTLSSCLVKIINVKGITNIPGFSRAILELHNPQQIYLLYDNDASPELADLIANLGIPVQQRFVVGDKEFEDSFSSDVLHRCWSSYLTACAKPTPETWKPDRIEAVKVQCKENASKFSKELKALNATGKKMTKPILGKVLGEYIQEPELPAKLRELVTALT